MRADRLVTILLLLESREQMTAERLARELEVTTRTIYRDVFALRVAGFPIESVKGTGGGYRVRRGQLGRLAHLTHEEIAALLSTPVPPLAKDLGWSERYRAASLKLASLLEKHRSLAGASTSERVFLDSSPWDESPETSPHLQTLHRGLAENRRVDVRFVRAREVEVSRSIGPCGLVGKATAWYVVWVDTADALHVDRVAQIVGASLTECRFELPPAFDLRTVWDAWCRLRRSRRHRFIVRIRLHREALLHVKQHLGDRLLIARSEAESKGWIQASVRYAWIDEARASLLGLGAAVEVLEPEPLRRSIESSARCTAELYAQER